MSQVLYRKYRSQRFSEILGQDRIITVLKQALITAKYTHAYLFSGPRGTGKTSTARILAKALNCLALQEDGEPCNQCPNCEAINTGRFLDFVEIDAASNRGIDEIRALKERVNFLPAEGKVKVYIIDEVHMLTKEAFNALLKTLEEPPSQVVFILATTEPHKVPATILSRTQRFDFDLAQAGSLQQKLLAILKAEGIEFEPAALELIITAARGSFRDAETLLDKILASVGYANDKVVNAVDVQNILGFADLWLVEELTSALLAQKSRAAFDLLSQIEQKGLDLAQLVTQILELIRSKMLAAIEQGVDFARHVLIIKELNKVLAELSYVPIPMLSLEVGVLSIVGGLPQQNVTKETLPTAAVVNGKQPVKLAEPKQEQTSKSADERQVEQEIKQPKAEVLEIEVETEIEVRPSSHNSNDVVEKWPEVLQLAKEFNHHLVAFLSKATVGERGGVVHIEVPFALYKKKLEEPKAQQIMANIFDKLGIARLPIKVILNKELYTETEQQSNSDLVEEVFAN